MSDKMEQNGHQLQWTVITLQNNPHPQALQWWHAEEKREFFFFYFMFLLLLLLLFQSCCKGYSLHDCKLKNTQECTTQMLTSKPMYKENKYMWGCITWCRSCIRIKPCVCVCVHVLPRPKAGSKTSFGAAYSFLPPKLRNFELHNL